MRGTQLGQYTLIRQLARGGMSEVYLAQKEDNERIYALKIASQEDERCYQRLQREMQALSKLRHPHILPILDYGEENGFGYCVTPYIEHGTLKERIEAGPLSIEEVEQILTQVADALQFIHEAGLVHRDIKPGNVLLGEAGQAWLADFGLAKELRARSDLTDSNCLIGTPFYMAPELVEHPATPSSDIYALGVVLYEMLTGRPPFTGNTPLHICWKHVYELPKPPSRYNRLLSPSLDRVILRALAKDQAQRFPRARDLAAAYHHALSPAHAFVDLGLQVLESTGEAITAMKSSRPIRAVRQRRQQARHFAIAAVMVTTLFTMGAFSLALGYQDQRPGPALANAQIYSLHAQATHAPHAPTVLPTVAPNAPIRETGAIHYHGNPAGKGDPGDKGNHGNKDNNGKGSGGN